MQELPGVEIAYVCDSNSELLETLTRRYPAVTGTTHFADILEDPTVDAVVIATPVGTHFNLASAALRAGKHVFVEKPLAGSSTDASALIELASERDLVLMPGHTFLYSPPVRAIKELIDAGDLGEIYFISTSRVNLGLHQTDVSVVWDLGPHDFSILRYLLGESPTHVTALSRGCILPGMPDVAFINLEFPSNTVAHVELSLARAEQAPAHHDRRIPCDGRVRRHQQRAGPYLRRRRRAAESRKLRRVPAKLPYWSHSFPADLGR